MVIKTFEAQVYDGRLHFQEPLADLEGQQVRVTIIAGPSSPNATTPSATEPIDEDGIEPPDWLQVEKDVYVKIPFRGEILSNPVIIDGGSLRPTAIFPEDLPE
jgi:hypothetical protein